MKPIHKITLYTAIAVTSAVFMFLYLRYFSNIGIHAYIIAVYCFIPIFILLHKLNLYWVGRHWLFEDSLKNMKLIFKYWDYLDSRFFSYFSVFPIVIMLILIAYINKAYHIRYDHLHTAIEVLLMWYSVLMSYYFSKYLGMKLIYFENERSAKPAIVRKIIRLVAENVIKNIKGEFVHKEEKTIRLIGHANMSILFDPCWSIYKWALRNGVSLKVMLFNPNDHELIIDWSKREERFVNLTYTGISKMTINKVTKDLLASIKTNKYKDWHRVVVTLSLLKWIQLKEKIENEIKLNLKGVNRYGSLQIRLIGNKYEHHQLIKAYAIGDNIAFIGNYSAPYAVGYLNSITSHYSGVKEFNAYYEELWSALVETEITEAKISELTKSLVTFIDSLIPDILLESIYSKPGRTLEQAYTTDSELFRYYKRSHPGKDEYLNELEFYESQKHRFLKSHLNEWIIIYTSPIGEMSFSQPHKTYREALADAIASYGPGARYLIKQIE